MNCSRCGEDIPHVFPTTATDAYPHAANWEYQRDNALIIDLVGGYGMFFDPIGERPERIILCHECAHHLISNNPWLERGMGMTADEGHAHRSAVFEFLSDLEREFGPIPEDIRAEVNALPIPE